MKKLPILIFILLLLCTLLSSCIYVAPTESTMIYDNQGVLNNTSSYKSSMKDFMSTYRMNMVVITTSWEDTAESALRELGYVDESKPVIALLIYVSSTYTPQSEVYMYCSDAYAENITNIGLAVRTAVHNKQYDLAVSQFIEAANEYVPKMDQRIIKCVGIGLLVAIIVVIIFVVVITTKYNKKNRSSSYPLKQFSSLKLTHSSDRFVRKEVNRIRISSPNHGGGGGRGGGGGGGHSSGRG